MGISTDEQEDISIPSSEDENEDKNNDTDYCPESAEEFLSSELSSDEGNTKIFIRFAFQIKYNSAYNKQIYRRLDTNTNIYL